MKVVQNRVSKLHKNDLNYLKMFFRGERSDQYLFNVILYKLHIVTELLSGNYLLGNMVPYWRSCIRVMLSLSCISNVF